MKSFVVAPPQEVSPFARAFDFENLRPYYDHEVQEAMQRLAREPLYLQLMQYFWPGISAEEAQLRAENVDSILDFQMGFMHHAIWQIVRQTSSGLSWTGIEHLRPEEGYLFVANHRDILLDSALLQLILVDNGFPTSEITFGSNLLETGFVTDFGRLNRMLSVMREGSAKELYEISRQLSAYIRHAILDRKTSVWIAQRNGRTKDGDDRTQPGLLKMLQMSGEASFAESFTELKIVPLSISYEYEPCDAQKVQECFLSLHDGRYEKAPGEDFKNIVHGIQQFKGHIQLTFGKPITANDFQSLDNTLSDNEKIKWLCQVIDAQILNNYQLHPPNYIAHDLLSTTNRFADQYTTEARLAFLSYTEQQVSSLKGDPEVLRRLFLELYAKPLDNRLAIAEGRL